MSTQPLLPTHTITAARLNARRLPPTTSSGMSGTGRGTGKGADKGKGKAVDYGSASSGDEERQQRAVHGIGKGKAKAVRGSRVGGKGKGRGAFISYASDSSSESSHHSDSHRHQQHDQQQQHEQQEEEDEEEEEEEQGRCITFRFTGSEGEEPDLEVWVEQGESVASVKEKIRTLRPSLAAHTLRFIHSGRLLTDGILLLPWLRSLETRLTRQAEGLGGVIRGLAEEGESVAVAGIGIGLHHHDAGTGRRKQRDKGKGKVEEKVWLHCVVGAIAKEPVATHEGEAGEEDSPFPTRRGFDSLLDAGFTPTEIAAMRREFYLSRGEEVPDEFLNSAGEGGAGSASATRDAGYEEHVRALEEQWIEGDLNNETAQTVNEGLYSSILHGLLIGFLYPLIPWFFFRDLPSPNFFDPLESPDAPAPTQSRHGQQHANRPEPPALHPPPADDSTATAATSVFGLRGMPGGDWRTGVVFGQRTQMAILIGTVLNVGFAGMRFLA